MKFVFGRALLVLWTLSFKSHGLPDPTEYYLNEVNGTDVDADLQVFETRGQVPFTSNRPMTANQLIAEVDRVFRQPLPFEQVYPPQTLEDIKREVVGEHKWATNGLMRQIDITAPWPVLCRPVIRPIKRLSTPIHCSGVACSPTVRFRVEERYETTERFRIETTVSAGFGAKGFEASISRTNEREWTKTWSEGSSQESSYTWHLGPWDECTPSMVHVELDCTVEVAITHYDTFLFFNERKGGLSLEGTRNRKRGPYSNGQWCADFKIDERPLRIEDDWDWVLDSDRGRGKFWKRPAREMRQFLRNGPHVWDDVIFISRQRGSPGLWTDVMGCVPDRRAAHRSKVTLPLSSDRGVLEGFIGCVQSGHSASEGQVDKLGAELKAKA